MKPAIALSVLVFLFVTVWFTATSCRRDKQGMSLSPGSTSTGDSTNPPCKFTGKYDMNTLLGSYIGSYVRFETNLPACAKRLWIYSSPGGHKKYSTELSPIYPFPGFGQHVVTMVLNNDTLNINGFNITKHLDITYPYNFPTLQKIGGVRLWNVVEDSVISNFPPQTKILKTYLDTFEARVIDSTTIVFKNDTLKPVIIDMVNGVTDRYTFIYTKTVQFQWLKLEYYPALDSMVCSVHPQQGGMPAPAVGKQPARPYGVTTTYTSVR